MVQAQMQSCETLPDQTIGYPDESGALQADRRGLLHRAHQGARKGKIMIKIEVDNLNVKVECDPSVGLKDLYFEAVTAIHSIADVISTATNMDHNAALARLASLAVVSSKAFADNSNKTVCIMPEVKRRADD